MKNATDHFGELVRKLDLDGITTRKQALFKAKKRLNDMLCEPHTIFTNKIREIADVEEKRSGERRRHSDAAQCPWCDKWFSVKAALGRRKQTPFVTRLRPGQTKPNKNPSLT